MEKVFIYRRPHRDPLPYSRPRGVQSLKWLPGFSHPPYTPALEWQRNLRADYDRDLARRFPS
jgi:hypothetical protein